MALSGSYDFTNTRDGIITRAYRIAGVIGEGETANTSQITAGAEALNDLCKEYQAMGMPLWAIQEYSFTPVASTISYTVGVGATINTVAPLKILRAWLRTNNYDMIMNIITREEYDKLGAKAAATGTSNQIMYIPPGGNVTDLTGTVKLYPIPDATMATQSTVYFVGQRPFQDFDASTNNPDFPVHWHNALVWGLATELAFEYGLGLSERGMIKNRAEEHFATASSFDTEEGSFKLHPAAKFGG